MVVAISGFFKLIMENYGVSRKRLFELIELSVRYSAERAGTGKPVPYDLVLDFRA